MKPIILLSILFALNAASYGQFAGPEHPVTGLSGFYDWQTNGDCKRQLFYLDEFNIHAIYMTSIDSLQVNPSRKTRYSFSSDGGVTWDFMTNVPSERSGFGYLTLGNSGISQNSAIIINHYGSPVKSYIHVDAFPGLGSFTSSPSNSLRNYIWPQVNTMENGNVLVAGKTFNDLVSTDTLAMQTFNPNTNQWGLPQFFRSGASDHFNIQITSATGPGGRALLVMSPIYDQSGPFNSNRIFYWTSNDFANSWTGPNIMYNTQIDNDGDTSKPWLGLDAVFDKYGNFYVVFNTLGLQGTYTSAKIWVNKNGTTNKIVARNSSIPGAMFSTAGSSMRYVCSMDWPSVSASQYGDMVCVAFSVAKQNDTLNGFNSMDIYAAAARTNTLDFNNPWQVTEGINDERYVSLNREFYGSFWRTVPMVYQKDPQPGTSAPDGTENAPLSRSGLIYREFTFVAELTGTGNTGVENPGKFMLHQNYPNPFNPSTSIKFDIPNSGNVRISIYDASGKLIEELVDKDFSPGVYETQWNGERYASGVYFYTLEAKGFKETRKMLLIK